MSTRGPADYGRRQAARYARRLERVRSRIGVVAAVRLGSFLVFAAFGFAAWQDDAWTTYGALAALGGLGFVIAAALHRRPYAAAPRIEALRAVHARRAARATGAWGELADDGARFLDADAPHLAELQVFGRGSLYQLIERCALPWSRARLAARLKSGLTPTEVSVAQESARELSAARAFRARLEAEGRLVDISAERLDAFVAWAAQVEPAPLARRLLWPARALVVVAWACIVASAAFGVDAPWKLALGVNVVVFMVTTGRLSGTYLGLVDQEQAGPFIALRRMFERVERRRFRAAGLVAIRADLTRRGSPARRIARLETLVECLGVRANPLSALIANALLLWEVQVVAALEAWRTEHGAAVREDIERLAELEVLSSIGGFSADHPDFAWPTVTEDAKSPLSGEGLGHPLIPADRRRVNDFTHPGEGHLVLITGSNMAGKSSFLRTLGLNALLAGAGAPVCARSLTLRPCALSTSIQVTDAPELGLSRFYAEVKRIRRILDACRSAATAPALPLRLFLIDEMLSGTNSRERHVASVSVARQLLEQPRAFGLVTTHDLRLVALARDFPGRVETWHFTDRFDGEALHFDYTLRPGVATTTNALDVLRLEGIEVYDAPT